MFFCFATKPGLLHIGPYTTSSWQYLYPCGILTIAVRILPSMPSMVTDFLQPFQTTACHIQAISEGHFHDHASGVLSCVLSSFLGRVVGTAPLCASSWGGVLLATPSLLREPELFLVCFCVLVLLCPLLPHVALFWGIWNLGRFWTWTFGMFFSFYHVGADRGKVVHLWSEDLRFSSHPAPWVLGEDTELYFASGGYSVSSLYEFACVRAWDCKALWTIKEARKALYNWIG